MKVAIYDADGTILRCVHCRDMVAAELNASGVGELWIEIGDDITDVTHCVEDGAVVQYSTPELISIMQPKYGYRWSAVHGWMCELSAAELRACMNSRIEAERDVRTVAPVIMYDSKNLDADERAIDNLTKKLAEVRGAIEIGDTLDQAVLVWKDYDNIIHSFADQATYLLWLNGFAVALGGRGTLAYAWSWQKKIDLLALGDDVGALEAFDPTS